MLRTVAILISVVQISVSVRRLVSDKCANGGDSTGCFIRTVSDIPTVPARSTARVFYAQAGIELGKLNTAAIDEYHTGITMVWDDGTNMTFQWYAEKGMANALLPAPIANRLEWLNTAVLVYSNNIDSKYWKIQTYLGEISGAQWDKFRQFLVNYASSHQRYLLWDVSKPDGTVLVKASICDTFTEGTIVHFFKDQLASLPAIKRNYGVLYADAVDKLNLTDPAAAMRVGEFYKSLANFEKEIMTTVMEAKQAAKNPTGSVQEVQHSVGTIVQHIQALAKEGAPKVYIGGYKDYVVYEVNLVKPFLLNAYSYMFPKEVEQKKQ